MKSENPRAEERKPTALNPEAAQKKDKAPAKYWVASLAASLVIILGGLILIEALDAAHIASRLLWPLTRLLLFITLGLFIGQLIEASGWIKSMAVLARPLFRFGHLGDYCSAAFTAAFFSGVTANAMLLDFFKEGHITRRQLFLSNFINQLPAFFLHLPTTFFIVIPLTGRAGALYFLITFLAVVLRTILFLVFGRLTLRPGESETGDANTRVTAGKKKTMGSTWDRIKSRLPRRIARIAVYVVPIYSLVFILNTMGMFQLLREALAVGLRTILFLVFGRLMLRPWESETGDANTRVTAGKKKTMGSTWDRIKSRLPRRIARIAVYVVPIYSLVFILNTMGMFQLLREALAGYVVTSFMPMESLSVIVLSFAAEFTSGFAAAGALLEAGVLTVKQTVLALLIGNILAFPVRALRHQLPRYIGIFSPKTGTQLLLLGQGFRIFSLIIVGIIYYLVA